MNFEKTLYEFAKFLLSFGDHTVNNIICGDFNIDLKKSGTYSNRVSNIINSQGMKQMVTSETRITEKSKTLIDYVISNNYLVKANVLLTDKISDHCTIEIELPKKRMLKDEVKYVNKLSKYCKESMCNDLLNVNWSSVSDYNLSDKARF